MSPRTSLERIQSSGKSGYQVGLVCFGVQALQLVAVGVHVVEFLLSVIPLYIGPPGCPEHVPAAAEVLHEDFLAPSSGPPSARREDRYQTPPVKVCPEGVCEVEQRRREVCMRDHHAALESAWQIGAAHDERRAGGLLVGDVLFVQSMLAEQVSVVGEEEDEGVL